MNSVVSVRELRQNLSVYLRRVEAGETLTVTRQGQPVAVLDALPGRTSILDRMAAEGRVIPATISRDEMPAPQEVEGGMTISEALQEQREERLP